MTKAKKLKAVFDFLPLPADGFVSRLTAIHDKMFGNAAFPNPPVELAAFMTAITTFAASAVVALDGSKQAIATMKKQHEGLVKMAELLGHYVEATCNNDPVTFTSSGFAMRSTTRVPPQLLAQPTIVRVICQAMTGVPRMPFRDCARHVQPPSSPPAPRLPACVRVGRLLRKRLLPS